MSDWQLWLFLLLLLAFLVWWWWSSTRSRRVEKPTKTVAPAMEKPAPPAASVVEKPVVAPVAAPVPAAKPIEHPAVEAVKPVVEDVKPVAKPVVETVKPVVEAAKPIEKAAEPVVAAVKAIIPDDLTIVEGIGPKTDAVLKAAGIKTLAELGQTDVAKLLDILKAAGLRLGDPTTWPEQAALAAAGKLDALSALQETLKGGRRR